jgi:hypothetical protein
MELAKRRPLPAQVKLELRTPSVRLSKFRLRGMKQLFAVLPTLT